MNKHASLDRFISASHYKTPSEIKKLKFIFSTIGKYVLTKNRDIQDLRILEVACGKGGITLPLTTLGCHVTAFDIDKKAVELLRLQANQNSIENLVVTVDNGYTFDDRQTYDVVIASEVFHHLLEPSRLAASIAKRMHEASLLIVTIPNGYGPYELSRRINPLTYLKQWNLLRRLFGKSYYVHGSGADRCRFYTRERFVELLSSFFRVVDFAKSDSLLAMVPLLAKNTLLGNLDSRIADGLPYWLASGWYFTCELHKSDKVRAG